MTDTTLDIYNLLVDAGIDAAKAEPLAKEILTRSEAREMLATKADMSDLKLAVSDFRGELYKALLLHGLIVVAAILGAAKFL